MGISGLLPLLKEIQVQRNISDFRGKRLAVDAYVWLHKGAFGCAEALVKGRKTTKFVDYAMYRVRMLRFHGITPYVVFDGGPLPAKRGTEDSRAKSRAEYLARATAFEAQGRLKDARDCYTKCLDITPEMAYQLIKALRAEGVDYVVAPYEADAQLCFLEREGFVDGIITEDSDLLVFGCKTVIFKLDKDGSCTSIDARRLATVRELPMHGWTDLQFRRMAMLSGCDYLPSIPGIGLKKAHKMLRRYKTVEKLLQAIRLEGALNIPPTYADDFSKAELAFLYQRVFDPEAQKLVTLSPLPDEGLRDDEEKWVGLDVEPEIAQGMARGDLHPETREPIEDQWPAFVPSPKGKGATRGSLDSFITITKVKRTRSAPVLPPVVPRIGAIVSGPSRLSDLPSRNLTKFTSDPGPSQPVTSKFFAAKSLEVVEEVELNWEESEVDVESQALRRPSSPASPEHVRSPSPDIRSPSPALQQPTPTRLELHELDAPVETLPDAHFTSPISVRSGFTTPPRSTPRKLTKRESPDPFSPPPSPSPRQSRGSHTPQPPSSPRSALQSSPTPARILVPSSHATPSQFSLRLSQFAFSQAGATVASSPHSEESYASSDAGFAKTKEHKRRLAVLVPASSPGLRVASSDSPADEDIVTPKVKRARGESALQPVERREVEQEGETPKVLKRPRVSDSALLPRRVFELDEEEIAKEKEREERAKIVAEGWRKKYAFNSSSPARVPLSAVPLVRSEKPAPASVASAVSMRKTSGGKSVKPKPGVRTALGPRQTVEKEDVPQVQKKRSLSPSSPPPARRPRTSLPLIQDGRVKPIRAGADPAPHGLSCAALERFRFGRK